MKKLLTGILALLTCFTCATAIACGDDNGGVTSDLAGAKDYLYGMYSDRDTAVRKDYEVVNVVVYDGVSYTVTWAVSGADSVSVKPGSSADYSLIDVDETKTEEVSYTLTATIADANGNTVTVSFDRVVSALVGDSIMTPAENTAYNMYIEQLTTGNNLLLTGNMDSQNKFFEMTTDNAAAASVYAEVAEGGYKFYVLGENEAKSYITLTEYKKDNGYWGASVSYSATGSVFYFDAVGVWACELENDTYFLGTYNTYETASASASNYMKAETIGVSQYPLLLALPGAVEGGKIEGLPTVEEPAADSVLTIPEAIDLGNELQRDSKNKYYITGKVTSIDNTTHGNMYIEDDNGNSIQVYGSYDADGTNRFDAMTTKPVVGDTVKLYTIVSYYNAPQLKNAWIQEINGEALGGGSDTPPVVPPSDDYLADKVVTNPAVDTAYNLYMYQGNAKKVVYLSGGMSSFYLATSEDATAAVTVKLETAEGGFYLYYLDGETKNYINIVTEMGTDGKEHTNAKIETTASTVYTFNTEYNTLVGNGYFLGTRNDKNYLTVGPCAESYIADNFKVCFVPAGESGGNGGTETPETPTLTTPEEILNALYALADGESLSGEFTLTGTITALDSYNNPTIVVEGFEDKPVYCYYLSVSNAVGETITVTAKGMKNYQGTYEFTNCTLVTEDSGSTDTPVETPVEGAVTISIADVAAANSWANGTCYASVTYNGVTLTTAGTAVGSWGLNTGKYYDTNKDWRVYQNESGTLTITAQEGKTIASVKITYNNKNGGVILFNETQVTSATVMTVNANSLTIGVGSSTGAANGNIQITSIEIVYAE